MPRKKKGNKQIKMSLGQFTQAIGNTNHNDRGLPTGPSLPSGPSCLPSGPSGQRQNGSKSNYEEEKNWRGTRVPVSRKSKPEEVNKADADMNWRKSQPKKKEQSNNSRFSRFSNGKNFGSNQESAPKNGMNRFNSSRRNGNSNRSDENSFRRNGNSFRRNGNSNHSDENSFNRNGNSSKFSSFRYKRNGHSGPSRLRREPTEQEKFQNALAKQREAQEELDKKRKEKRKNRKKKSNKVNEIDYLINEVTEEDREAMRLCIRRMEEEEAREEEEQRRLEEENREFSDEDVFEEKTDNKEDFSEYNFV